APAACRGPDIDSANGGHGGSAGGGSGGAGGGSGGTTAAVPDGSFGYDRLDGGPVITPDGAGPTCAEDTHTAKRVPLDLLLLVDSSESMKDLAGDRPSGRWRATP